MSDERETAAMVIKFVFDRKGKDVMTREEIVLSLSADQSWLSPEEAKGFVRNSIGSGLIRQSGEGFAPTQEVLEASLPMAFNPDADRMRGWAKKRDLFQETLDSVVRSTGLEKKKIISEANRIKARLNIDVKVALLMVAMKHGVDVSEMAEEVERDLVARRIDEEENS